MRKVKSVQIPYKQIVDEILDLYSGLLVPFMKIRRDMPFPGENGRHETDSEHVFTVGMLAITVSERLNLDLDTGLIAKYALIHDLVEAYAGDVSVRDAEAYFQKEDKEHKALLLIQERYQKSSPWMAKHIEKYEARLDDESKLVYAVDKFMGAMARMTENDEHWAEYYPEKDGSSFHKVVERLRQKAKTYPPVLPLFDAVYEELDSRWPSYLAKGKR